MARLLDRVDKIQEDISDIKIMTAKQTVILEKNTESLIVHEKRTTAAEQRIKELEDAKLAHKSFMRGFCYFLSASTVISLIGLAVKFLL